MLNNLYYNSCLQHDLIIKYLYYESHYVDFSLQSKVVRVLNLWQKNSVFLSEVIQPLLDMASDPNNQQHSLAGI